MGVNGFTTFDAGRAKHVVPVTPAGRVIGDTIIFREHMDKLVLAPRAPTANRVCAPAAVGTVRLVHEPRSPHAAVSWRTKAA